MNDTNTTSHVWNVSATYVFAPVDDIIKVIIAGAYAIAGVYGLVASSLILYFTYKRQSSSQELSRQSLVDSFIQSLALSDVLCLLISLPVFTVELFVDFIKTDLSCKVVRYFTMYFPIATVINYLLIGIERYLGIFYPLYLPSVITGKRLVVAAWFVAALIDMIPRPSYFLVRFEVDNNMYTHTCKYDNTTPLYRTLFLSFNLIVWVIPSIVLCVTNIKILQFLRHRRRVMVNNPQVTRANMRRYKTTNMFVSLIFAFIIPYMLFILFSSINMTLKLKITFTADYLTRYASSFLGYANSAISSTIMFYSSTYHRRKLVELFSQSPFNANRVININTNYRGNPGLAQIKR